jgi:hypothetical protein
LSTTTKIQLALSDLGRPSTKSNVTICQAPAGTAMDEEGQDSSLCQA